MACLIVELQTQISSQRMELEILSERVSDAPLSYRDTRRSLKKGFGFRGDGRGIDDLRKKIGQMETRMKFYEAEKVMSPLSEASIQKTKEKGTSLQRSGKSRSPETSAALNSSERTITTTLPSRCVEDIVAALSERQNTAESFLKEHKYGKSRHGCALDISTDTKSSD